MSPSTPHISVVLPVRNGAKYLTLTLDSIFQQTYSNFDVIILENCSDDDTPEILRACQDSRLRVLPSTEPLSIEANWARMLDLDLAEYMTIVSHDDLLYPNFLQAMVDLIVAEPQASLYGSHFDIIDPQGSITRQCLPIPFRESAENFLHARQHYNRNSFGTGYVMRSDDYKKVGGLPPLPSLYYADDLAVYKLAKLSEKVCSPERLFAYRYHRFSASYVVPLETLYEASKQYLLTLTEAGYSSTLDNALMARQYIEKTYNRRCHRFLVDLILADDKQSIEAYKVTKKQLLEWESRDKLFTVYDSASKITEWFLNLPVPWARKLIARIIELFGVMTRKIRK